VSVYTGTLGHPSELSEGQSYILYTKRCSLNDQLLEFSADESWDVLELKETVQKELLQPSTDNFQTDLESETE
jgi:hypothetical protein